MDCALTMGSPESLRDFLMMFFSGRFCDSGLWYKRESGVTSMIHEAAEGVKVLWLSGQLTLNRVCSLLEQYDGEFIVVDSPLWESAWGRALMMSLAECEPVKHFAVRMQDVEKVFDVKAKVLMVFPMGSDFPLMEALTDHLQCFVYNPS